MCLKIHVKIKQKNKKQNKKLKHIKHPVHSLLFLKDYREMFCWQLNQTIFILCNHFYELNLHQFHNDQQYLANHLMKSTCLKMIDFLIIFCHQLNNIREYLSDFHNNYMIASLTNVRASEPCESCEPGCEPCESCEPCVASLNPNLISQTSAKNYNTCVFQPCAL